MAGQSKQENKEKKEQEKEKKERYTKYEIARILGARALQLAMNAPMLLSISKAQLQELGFDPLKIAEKEFNAGVLPITVKRPLPKKIEEEEVAEVEEIVSEKEEKPLPVTGEAKELGEVEGEGEEEQKEAKTSEEEE